MNQPAIKFDTEFYNNFMKGVMSPHEGDNKVCIQIRARCPFIAHREIQETRQK